MPVFIYELCSVSLPTGNITRNVVPYNGPIKLHSKSGVF